MPSPPFNPATAEKIAALRETGLSVAAIASRFNVSRGTVYAVLKVAQKQPPKPDRIVDGHVVSR